MKIYFSCCLNTITSYDRLSTCLLFNLRTKIEFKVNNSDQNEILALYNFLFFRKRGSIFMLTIYISKCLSQKRKNAIQLTFLKVRFLSLSLLLITCFPHCLLLITCFPHWRDGFTSLHCFTHFRRVHFPALNLI